MSLIVEVPSHLSHSSADSIVGSYCPSSYFFDRVQGKQCVHGPLVYREVVAEVRLPIMSAVA